MLDLYCRSAKADRIKDSIRGGKRFGRFPPAFTHRRHRVGDPKKAEGFLVFPPDINAGSCFYRSLGVVLAVNLLILPVDFLNVFFFHIEYKAFASVPIELANLPDAIPANEQIHPKTENGHTDNRYDLVRHIIKHGHAHPPNGDILGNQENKKDRSIRDDPIDRFFLDCFTEADRAYDLFEQKSETEARPHAGKLRPAGKPGDRFTEAITQRRDESDHNIIERKQFSHLFPARSFKDSKRAV